MIDRFGNRPGLYVCESNLVLIVRESETDTERERERAEAMDLRAMVGESFQDEGAEEARV